MSLAARDHLTSWSYSPNMDLDKSWFRINFAMKYVLLICYIFLVIFVRAKDGYGIILEVRKNM